MKRPRHQSHLADEPGDEQQHKDAVVVPAVAQEAVGHEGGEEGDVPVRLLHLHLAQLHLDGLQDTHADRLVPARPSVSRTLGLEKLESLSSETQLALGKGPCS